MGIRISEIIVALLLLLLGACVFLSLFVAVLPQDFGLPEACLYPGDLFYSGFSWFGFYIPLFLFFCSFFIISGSDYRRPVLVFSVLHVPAVTLGLGLRILLDAELHPILMGIVNLSGNRRNAFLMSVLTAAVEALVILWLCAERRPREKSNPETEYPPMPDLPPVDTISDDDPDRDTVALTRDREGFLRIRPHHEIRPSVLHGERRGSKSFSADLIELPETGNRNTSSAESSDDIAELESADNSDIMSKNDKKSVNDKAAIENSVTGVPQVSNEEYVREGEPGTHKGLYEVDETVESLVRDILDDDYVSAQESKQEPAAAQETADFDQNGFLEELDELEELEELEDVNGADPGTGESDDYSLPQFSADLDEDEALIIETVEPPSASQYENEINMSLEYDDEQTALDPDSIVIDMDELEAHFNNDESDDEEADDLLYSADGSRELQGELVKENEKKKTDYSGYTVPVDRLLKKYGNKKYWVVDKITRDAGETLRQTLEEFKIEATVTGIRKGPVITMYEILPAPGVKLSKITNLADNIALRLAASSVRIVAPIPGKHAVGIEVPNQDRSIVSFHEMINDDKMAMSKYEIPVVLGKDITGESRIIDLVHTPHLLIAGATGSGKSVCVNSLICTILCCKTPEEVKLMLIDPKIVELKLYNDIPHLLTPVITEPKKAFQALQYCLYEMERRYSLLDSQGVRDIKSYNRKIKMKRLATLPLPYFVVIVDEFADLMASTGKELESVLARLAAMARAVGIHLVLATQRPSIDVITGLIKANIPSRIAFMVAGKFDSRIILDAVGAEKLLGKGDMLFTSAWDPQLIRVQGSYLSEEEVCRVVAHVKTLGEPDYIDDEIFIDDEDLDSAYIGESGNDPLMDKAVEIVTGAGKASASYLQRRLKIGYNRAARLVEEMEDRGIVGPQNGSKPREILHIPR